MQSSTISPWSVNLAAFFKSASNLFLPTGSMQLYSAAKVAGCFSDALHALGESPSVVFSNVKDLSKTFTDYYEGLSILSDISFLLSRSKASNKMSQFMDYSRIFGSIPLHMLGALSFCKKMGVISKIDILNLGALASRIGNISIKNSKPLQVLENISSDGLGKFFFVICLVSLLSNDVYTITLVKDQESQKKILRSRYLSLVANCIMYTVTVQQSYQNTRTFKVICLVGAVCKFASIKLSNSK